MAKQSAFKGKGIEFVVNGKKFNPKDMSIALENHRKEVMKVIERAVRAVLREFVDHLRETRSERHRKITEAGRGNLAQRESTDPNTGETVITKRYVDDPFYKARIRTNHVEVNGISTYYTRVLAGPDDPMKRAGKDYSLFDLMSRGRPAFTIKKPLVLPIWEPPNRTTANDLDVRGPVSIKKKNGRFIFVRLPAGTMMGKVEPRNWYALLAEKAQERAIEELKKRGLHKKFGITLDGRNIKIKIGGREKNLTGGVITGEE